MPNNRGVTDRQLLLIAGLQRTGTNFVQALINRNLRQCRVDWPMIWWKHDYRPITPQAMQAHSVHEIILVMKNPYTWAESICHRTAADISNPKYNKDYSIRGPGYCINGINLKNLMRLYKDFYTNWLDTAPTLVVRYEDMLVHQGRRRLFDEISTMFDISEIPEHIRVPRKVPFTQREFMGCLDHYRLGHAPLLTAEDIRLINKTLRSDFFERLGYTRIKI